jgi:hypothetical protein
MGFLWILIPYGERICRIIVSMVIIPYGKGIENKYSYIYVKRFPHSIGREEGNSHVIIPSRG